MAARYEAVLLGHIHRPQIIEGFDNVFYSGAINAMNFNDEGQDRGFWIHEFNEKGTLVKGHRYTTPYRQFHTITWILMKLATISVKELCIFTEQAFQKM